MSTDQSYVNVARLSDIAEGRSARVRLDDEEIALWRVRGKFYAISNVCSHQHFSELHRGILSGLTVACPMHGWTYSLETGIAVTGNGRVRTYDVKVEGESVFIARTPPEREEQWTR
jgi:NAD(P)H-dependent nitrite reductase small subunit